VGDSGIEKVCSIGKMASNPVDVVRCTVETENLSYLSGSPALSAQTIHTLNDQEINGVTPLNTQWTFWLDK
jgi:hypothetical protein